MTFGDRLKELRDRAGLTQERLAQAAGLSVGAVREYEQNRRQPVLSNAFLLAKALGVKVDAFATDDDGTQKPSAARPAAKRRKK